MTRDDRRWATWLAAVLGSFAVLEGRALRCRADMVAKGERSGTLTAFLRHHSGVAEGKRRGILFAGFVGGFSWYLYMHLIHGWYDS